jgi:anthranilate/para-aminobenzoate synthase component II
MKRVALLLSLLIASPAVAEQAPQNTNIAGPTASATGNVTNQAVQVLQGPYPITTFGMGVSCPGPALTIAPFSTGNLNNSTDPYSYQSQSASAGITIGFSTPLNGTITETCLEAARTTIARNQAETDKARLDFELVRALRCGEMKRNGIQFHPNSPYAAICADIVVINTPVTPTNNETPVSQGQRTEVPAASKRQTY